MGARVFAWLAHAYTALGLVCAAAIFWLVVEGGDDAFRLAFLGMVIATAIDATDGWLARRARVSDVLPGFDGRRLDDLIDFQTYTCLPLALLWRAGVLPAPWQPWLLVPLVASAYGFCQVHAKTDDHYFLGFPSYWNIVAFYIYVLHAPATVALTLILVLSALTLAAHALPVPVASRTLGPSHQSVRVGLARIAARHSVDVGRVAAVARGGVAGVPGLLHGGVVGGVVQDRRSR